MALKSLIFAGGVQALFQVSVLQIFKKNVQTDRWLMSWLFLVGLQLFFYCDALSNRPFLNSFFGLIAFSIPLLSAPVLYQYIAMVSLGRKIEIGRFAIYIFPWIIYLIGILSLKFSNPGAIFMQFGFPHFRAESSPLLICFFTAPIAVVPGIYALMGLVLLMKYQKTLPDRYSYTERISLDWLKWLTTSIPILFILVFVFIRFGSHHLISSDEIFLYVGIVISLYVFMFSYFSLRQNIWLLAAVPDSHDEEGMTEIYKEVPYKKSGLDSVKVDDIFHALLAYMHDVKPFLRDDLSLSQLAKELSVNPNQLSQVINQRSGGNFFSFVNGYRVEEVKKKLMDPSFSHLSILGIAMDSGFRSKSAFNRIFSQQVGMEPGQYKKMSTDKSHRVG
ncbi:helix-turn-helix domain-containing protein [Pedobacter aquatilis]|uniref:helix-turn-helix domain-containing protein n=1 Tax=Pedobacter aquatilis TaxID=351343 RepID=UPI0029308ECC|nr:helix-turn-helix domain-containing protein [Pedobacter aquatilis]